MSDGEGRTDDDETETSDTTRDVDDDGDGEPEDGEEAPHDDRTPDGESTVDRGGEESEPADADTGDGTGDGHGESMGIEAKVERVEAIVERLESGEPGLAEAKRLRDEGKRLVADLRADLDADGGDVVELDDGGE